MQLGDLYKGQVGNVAVEKAVEREGMCFLLTLGQSLIVQGFSVFIHTMDTLL